MASTSVATDLFSSMVPVTAAVYRNGKEKAGMKWNFEISPSPADSALVSFKKRLYESYAGAVLTHKNWGGPVEGQSSQIEETLGASP